MSKKRVAILFGGKSAEHEVSLRSARSIADALDKQKYDVALIGIDKSGHWLPPSVSQKMIGQTSVAPAGSESVALIPESAGELSGSETGHIDVVFPVLHGPFGEDGTVQGLLRLANVPFVGAGVLGSAVGMDKDVMKRLLRDAGIPIGAFVVATPARSITFAAATGELGLPLFIKPANLGSSVGVSKVRDEAEYTKALEEAFRYDTKVLIEAFIEGKEVECAVLGNDTPVASVPGELILKSDFYSYEAKYVDDDAMVPKIPADLTPEITRKVQEISVAAFIALCCEGMGRVDSFVTKDGQVLVNEINTIPGFTSISMYPKLWEASGLPYPQLLDRLIELALERHERQQKLKTNR